MSTTSTQTLTKPSARVWAVLLTLVMVLAASISIGTAKPAQAAETKYSGYTLSAAQKLILDQTNAARKKAGLRALKASPNMNTVAVNWSKVQASKNRMYHNPNYTKQIGAGWHTAAENVAYGYSVKDVVNAWMKSPGHKANILNKKITHMGIGLAKTSKGLIYYTQDFAGYTTFQTTKATSLMSKATTKSTKYYTIPKGTNLIYRAVSGSWMKTEYKGKTGWVDLRSVKKV